MIEVAALRLFCNKISHSQRASNTSVFSAFGCKTEKGVLIFLLLLFPFTHPFTGHCLF